jgi:hypothetical protein
MVTWGENPPLGRPSPLSPDAHPTAAGLAGILTVAASFDDACAIGGGIAYCWGRVVPNSKNKITGTALDRALPEPVWVPEPVVDISTTHTTVTQLTDADGVPIDSYLVRPRRWCASTVTGSVYCWGYNESGQAGTGDRDYVDRATRVEGLSEPIARVKTTPNATCALSTSGKVYCWGSNFNGQLGNGKVRGLSLVPEEVRLP